MNHRDGLKNSVIEKADAKEFIPHYMGFRACIDMDGTHARQFLEALGFNVIENKDAGRYGYALTDDGIMLHTNGYCQRV